MSFFTGHLIIGVLIIGGIVGLLLILPVLNDMFLTSVSPAANKMAKRLFWLGLAVMVTGLIAGVPILVGVGALVMAVVLIVAIVVYY